ncbi:unnamed protein product [Musa acuminata subsp. burmannicoides]
MTNVIHQRLGRRNGGIAALPTILIYHHPYSESDSPALFFSLLRIFSYGSLNCRLLFF